jgi:Domain of unknown function (DUF4968)
MPRLLRLVPLFLLASLAIAPSYGAQWNPQNPVQSFHKDSDGATIFLKKGALRFQVCTDSMVRVRFSPEREFPKVPDYVVIKSIWPQTPFDVTETAEAISLTTAKLKLLVTKKNSVVVFYDSAGKNSRKKTTGRSPLAKSTARKPTTSSGSRICGTANLVWRLSHWHDRKTVFAA